MTKPRYGLPAAKLRRSQRVCTAAVVLAIVQLVTSAWLAAIQTQAGKVRDGLAGKVLANYLRVETVFTTLQDAESGQRGYLLTGQPDYLAPYYDALNRIGAEFSRMDPVPFAGPDWSRAVDHIRRLSAEKLAEMGRTVALYKSGSTDEAVAMVRTDRGERAMAAIRNDVHALQTTAVARIAEIMAANHAALAWFEVVGLGASACALLGVVAVEQRRRWLFVAASLAVLERFSRAFGLAPGMMLDLDRRITFWGDGSERLYGYRREAALGRKCYELLGTEFPQPMPEIQAQLVRDGYWQGDLTRRRQDGVVIQLASTWALHHGEAGESDAVIEVDNDITALQRAGAELRESDLKLHLALDASKLGVFQWKMGHGTGGVAWDWRCKALFGLAPDAPVDYRFWADAVLAEDRAGAEADVSRALDPANPSDEYVSEYRLNRKDGTVVWLAASGRALFTPDASEPAGRRAVQLIGTVHDISAAKLAEQERQLAEAMQRLIVDTAPGLIYAKDRQGRMLLANQRVLDVIGKPFAEVEGRTDVEFQHDRAVAEMVMQNDLRVMQSGQTEEMEHVVGSVRGTGRAWLSTTAPLRDASGTVIGLVGVSVEITELKRNERRLRQMVNELNHRVKNTLATVQAIALQTLVCVEPAILQALEDRLQALACVHDVLTRERWQGAELSEVAEAVLKPFFGTAAPRIRAFGPNLRLGAGAAQSIAMCLNELATNALKYGALSNEEGRVEMRWEVTQDAEPLLRLTWTERHGPAVAAPKFRGFGSRFIERSIAQDLRGTVCIDFGEPEGITCRIETKLLGVVAPAEVLPFPAAGERPAERAWS